jgi:hypothetical protein
MSFTEPVRAQRIAALLADRLRPGSWARPQG